MSEKFEKEQEKSIDLKRRRFLITASTIIGGAGALCALNPFISALLPSAKTKANAGPIEVDLSHLQVGEQLTVVWRGKPVWVIKRNHAMLKKLKDTQNDLRDPLSLVPQQPVYAQNVYRSINPEYLVIIGLCTHLGCTPKFIPKEKPGFYCPCHGSIFDLAGRVFKGVPAPINMEIPPYYFKTPQSIVIGQDKL